MNMEKRRLTKIVPRDKAWAAQMKPLLETKDLLKTEYPQEPERQLYELTLKRKKDIDKIPIHVSLFGKLTKFVDFY